MSNILAKLPSPGPSSTKLILLGFPSFSQVEIIQIPIISEKISDIFGAVTNLLFFQKDSLWNSNLFFYRKGHY